jgi:hypothetical protein
MRQKLHAPHLMYFIRIMAMLKLSLMETNTNKKGKIVVVHSLNGILGEGVLKKERKVFDVLKQDSMHLS